jgi:hypothetical protein
MVRRSALLPVLLLAALVSTSCAHSDSGGGPAAPHPAACVRTGAGFALSIAMNGGGELTPLAAAVGFGEHGGVPGYRAAAAKWITAPNPTDSNGQDAGGVTLRAGGVYLHAVQLQDGTWAVDSGGHCRAAG